MSSWTWSNGQLAVIGVLTAVSVVALVMACLFFGDDEPPAV